ncbi:nuclear pore complex protein Nup85 [Onthophagus taurus]|uniref:nuclear pore complex protein Nup85 n=1 Tax=Onthophagus taurus TaxID=166361 RepID=UPI000C2023C6|nr:nuclear pore complex protein Nup85 [Onthophagus taurus]
MSSKETMILIPNDLCKRSGISASFISMNDVSIFPYQFKKLQQKDTTTPFHPTNTSIFHIRKEVILYNEVLRKLLNESNGIFLNLQTLMISKRVDYEELVQVSLQYRSVIRECLENLQEDLLRNNGDKNELESLIMIFYSIECIWHLCEILFIKRTKENFLLNLLNWVQFHFPKYEKKSTEFLNENNILNPDINQNYWETVIGTLLQGKLDVTCSLLNLHPNSSSVDFQMVIEILKSFPNLISSRKHSNTEFKLRFKHWQVETRSKLDAKLFEGNTCLEFLMKLTVGDENAWYQVIGQCETWYEFLVGWLVFNEPLVRNFELGRLAKKCIHMMGVKDKIKHLDKVILAAMEGDILQVMKEVQHMNENGWFVTHLTDLFYHSGCLDILDKGEGNIGLSDRLRESQLLEYGTLMMSHTSLWQLGLSYLDYCPTDGLNTIALLLPRIKSNNELKTRKIIKEALKRDMFDISQSMCKIQSNIALTRKRSGTALNWALKSQDANFASQIADKFLTEYVKKGTLKNSDLLYNLGPGMLVSDRLTFLGKYSEFHKIYAEKKYKEAGMLLVSLISSRITPKYFWPTLFIDALPLLESDVLVFSSNDTFTLLNFLEEKLDINRSFAALENKVELIRLGLARNLGKSLTFEAQHLM